MELDRVCAKLAADRLASSCRSPCYFRGTQGRWTGLGLGRGLILAMRGLVTYARARMSRFTSILLVSPLADGSTWVLMRSFGYDVGDEGSGDQINVPIGFQTDFATIPRPFWAILPKWGKYGNAAVIHDWLYWTQTRPRPAADGVLLEAMGVLGVGAVTRYLIYGAVRAFGWLAWWRNQMDRAAQFDRVLTTLPSKAWEASERRGQAVQLVRHLWRKGRAASR